MASRYEQNTVRKMVNFSMEKLYVYSSRKKRKKEGEKIKLLELNSFGLLLVKKKKKKREKKEEQTESDIFFREPSRDEKKDSSSLEIDTINGRTKRPISSRAATFILSRRPFASSSLLSLFSLPISIIIPER